MVAPAHRHGLSEVQSLSDDVHRGQRHSSACGSTASAIAQLLEERAEESLRMAALVGRSQGPPDSPASASPAASSSALHRPRHRGRTRGPPHGRTLLGARSVAHRASRGTDPRAAASTTPSSSSPTTCSRPRASPIRRPFFTTESSSSIGETAQIFIRPRSADRRLHHRTLRLSEMGRSRHILRAFDAALDGLRADVLMMASLTDRNLQNAMTCLLDRDGGHVCR